MKIALFYTRPFETGGVEKTMYERGKQLSKYGHDITFIFNSIDSPLDMLDKWSRVGKVKHYSVAKDETFDLVIYDAVYNLAKVKARNNNYTQVINGLLGDSKERYETIIPFKNYVAVSEEAQKQFKEIYGKDSIVIPNLIDEEEIRKLAQEEVNIPKKKHNFVIVSRIDKQKGFDNFEKILKQCEKEYGDDYQFVVVGGCVLYNNYVEKLKNQLQHYNVIWEGVQDNPYKYMRWADALWQFSHFESQCMVMYESLIIGTPCVCTPFPNAIKELKDGKGVILDLNNIDFKAINKLKKGFEYNYPNYIEKWLELVENVPKKKDYKFSVIIPNYNNGEYLEKCLNSVLKQTYKNYEIIFIDDMSTDNSLEIAERMLKGHKIIKAPYKKYNGGARNLGIVEATGDYVICLDSDDWLKTDKVFETINDNLNGEDIMFLGFDIHKDGKDGLGMWIPQYKSFDDAFISEVCAIWEKVVKTKLLKDTLFPESTLAEDRVQHYRLCDKAETFTNLDVVTHVWNRDNKHSVTTKRELLWNMSIYKHLGEMYMFMGTTKNQKYKNYVQEIFNKQWRELNEKEFRQL